MPQPPKRFGSTALALPKGVATKDGGEDVLEFHASKEVEAENEGSGEKATLDKLLLVVRVEGMTPKEQSKGTVKKD